MDRIAGIGQQAPVVATNLTKLERDRHEEVKTLVRAVDMLNKTDLSDDLGAGNSLDLSLDSRTGRSVISFIEEKNGEVLFQMPTKAFLELLAQKSQRR